MKELYLFVGIYIIFFSFYMIYFKLRSKKNKQKMVEVLYLEKKYNLNLSKVNYQFLCRNIALINTFIIVSTLFVINYFENMFIKLLLAFSTIFILIIILYGILAVYYRRNIDE